MNKKIAIRISCFAISYICATSLNGQIKEHKAKNAIQTHSIAQEIVEISGKEVLKDTLYIKLLKEGWSREEAIVLMDKIMGREMTAERNTSEATIYRKFGRPQLSSNTLPTAGYFLKEHSTADVHQVGGVLKAQSALMTADQTWTREFYDHTSRLTSRTPGRFRHAPTQPASGRIEWAEVNPDDANKLYLHPDGDGIWATADMGRTWRPITDNIPNRYHRSTTQSYSIPVDPADWNHLFAMIGFTGNPVYETSDGGNSWTLVAGATHKDFKRCRAFRNAANELVLVGAKPPGHYSGTYPALNTSELWISKDKGVTWTRLDNNTTLFPTSYKLANPDAGNGSVPIGNSGYWFQEICFHPTNKDVVWLPCMNAIFRTDNAFGSVIKMTFNVYAADGTTIRSSNVQSFPFKATGAMMMNINPNNPSEMWVALGNRADGTSAMYKSTDAGANWTTLHEKTAGIGTGEKSIFQNEVAWVWLGGFGVNYFNTNKIWGTSMATAYSLDGGASVQGFSWTNRVQGIYPDGNKYSVSVGSHNADNHFILSHKTGRLFRGCDTGILTLDPTANTEWYNISGDMGQQLFAHLQTNEFGAQAFIGNTQDCNAQTYRKGRWGKDRGYETATAWINSISSEEHFSGGWGTRLNMTNADYNSWSRGWSKADVCNGYWYLRRESSDPRATDRNAKFFVVKDFGQVAISLDTIAQTLANVPYYVEDFAVTRDTKAGRVIVLTENNRLYYSDTQGSSFNLIKTLSGDYRCIAANPLNQKEIYLGGNGILQKSTDGGANFTSIYSGLPAGIILHYIFYHEGTGDLYVVGLNDGVFYQQKGTSTWRLWMTGYNPAAFTTAMINYTTQEFIINDYGRGVWIADLERPADRFFSTLCSPPDAFKLRVKELSNIDGSRTFGIDTYWTIPMYYQYEWYIDNVLVPNNNYQYLSNITVNAGQKVKVKLTLIESPDVSTTSEEYTVANSTPTTADWTRGNMITSNRSGRVDLGNIDYFSGDFTVEFWAKINKDGILIGNRQKHNNTAKGWYLASEAGTLKFNYAPLNVFCRPLNETSNATDADYPSKTLNAGTITPGKWAHIAITQQKTGNINVYVNGLNTLLEIRQLSAETLNNACNLSLFADAYGNNMIDASVDELRIWDGALNIDAIRKAVTTRMIPSSNKLLYRQSFNANSIDNEKEQFTQKGIQIRVEGNVTFTPSPLSILGEAAEGKAMQGLVTTYSDGIKNFAKTSFRTLPANNPIYATRYDDDFTFTPNSNLNSEFHTVCPTSFSLRSMNGTNYQNDSLLLSLYIDPAQASSYHNQRLYGAGISDSKELWRQIGILNYNLLDQSLECTVRLGDIDHKELILVKVNPSIELSLATTNQTNVVNIASVDQLRIPIKAEAVAGLTAPITPYNLTCNIPGLSFSQPISFFNNKGTTEMIIPQELLGTFGNTVELSIKGDEKSIPMTLKVVNKIITNFNLKGLKVQQGGAVLGAPGDLSAMDNTNKNTTTCWVKIEDASMLSGFHALLMVRSEGKSYGLHLQDGEFRCHYNEESWSWNQPSNLRITADMIGKWVHLALVSDVNSITYYMNGRSTRVNRTQNPTAIKGALLILKNTDGDNSFIGSIDEITMWNKSLTQSEIVRLMHNTPEYSPNLVAYMDFDRKMVTGYLDYVQDLPVRFTGSTPLEISSTEIPFVSSKEYVGLTGDRSADASSIGIGLNFGATIGSGNFSIARFDRVIDGTLNGIPAGFAPLSSQCYVVTTSTTPTAGNATIQIENTALALNDQVLIAYRSIGGDESLTTLIQSTVTTAGSINLSCTASLLAEKQIAVYHKSAAAGLPIVTTLQSSAATDNRIILQEGQTTIPLTLNWSSGGRTNATIYINSPFATIDRSTADFSLNTNADYLITIDRDNLIKLDWNTLQINATGAQPLHLEISLAPKIALSLKNGNNANTISSTHLVGDLEIEATLEEGILSNDLQFNVLSNDPHQIVTAMGDLLSESSVKNLPLEYLASGDVASTGWSLIGNPYLSNINLTQAKNVTTQSTGRFVYPYDPVTGNYQAVDMLGFDATQKIAPFATFYVQSTTANSQLTIHPQAKQSPQTKETRTIALTEIESIRLGLFAGNTLCDETTVRLNSNYNTDFDPTEDALKLWSHQPQVRGIGIQSGETTLSVGAFPYINQSVALTFNIPKDLNDNLSIRVLDQTLASTTKIFLEHKTDGSTLLNANSNLPLTLPDGAINNNLYTLRFAPLATHLEGGKENPYKVITDSRQATIVHLKGDARVAIFDLNGKQIADQRTHQSQLSIALDQGTYLVKVLENGKEFTATFIIK